MAITFGTGGGVKEMQQWHTGDTTTGWGGPNDGLEGFGAAIEGTDCVIFAGRKNENVTITYTSTVANVPADSQLIYNFYTILGAVLTSLSVDVNDGATGTANFNILPEFTGDASITLKSFIAIALDMTAGTLNLPTNDLSDVGYNVNISNVTIKATDNNFWDVAYVGNGVTLIGTTVSDALFQEAQANDISADIHNGVLLAYEEVIFCQSNIDINTTTGNSTNESLTFVETLNGINVYALGGTGTAVFAGTNIQATGTATLSVDMSNMTAFTMTGGSFKSMSTVTFGVNTLQRATFSEITTLNSGTGTFNANTLDTITTANIQTLSNSLRLQSCTNVTVSSGSDLLDCFIDDSGRIDISGGNRDILRCQFTDPSATTAAVLASPTTIANITDSVFTRTTGTSNAVDIGDVGTTTSIDWSGNTLTGYGTQLAGNGISSTANGAIAVNFTSNVVLTIQVVGGATVPTVEISGTGTVNIVSAITMTVTNLKDNTEVRILQTSTLDNIPPYATPTELAGIEIATAGTVDERTFAFAISSGTGITVRTFNQEWIADDITTTPTVSGNIQVAQRIDRVYDNPT